MRRAHALIVGLALALGCTLEGEPDDLFFFFGRVTDPAGAAKPGASVVVHRSYATGYGCPESLYERNDPSFFEYRYSYDDGGMTTTIRRYSDAGTPFAPYNSTVANDDGEYAVELMRYELMKPDQFSYSGALCIAMGTSGGDGSSAMAWAYNGSSTVITDVKFPDLTPWEGVALTAVPAGASLEIAAPPLPWSPTPPDGGPRWVDGPFGSLNMEGEGRYYAWALGESNKLAWLERTYGAPLVVTPPMLEDFAGLRVTLQSLHAVIVPPPAGFGPSVSTRDVVETAALAIPVGGLIPKSRGAPCSVSDQNVPGCFLTDGLLDLSPASTAYGVESWQIDLGGPSMPTLAVIRDLQSYPVSEPDLLVQGLTQPNPDAGVWRVLGRLKPAVPFDGGYDYPAGGNYRTMAPGLFLQVSLDAGTQPVRYVRFTTDLNEMYLGDVREVSIFE